MPPKKKGKKGKGKKKKGGIDKLTPEEETYVMQAQLESLQQRMIA